jgi:4-amino-4-deoxy-L-arabinose transferase-like glycosyltransferase
VNVEAPSAVRIEGEVAKATPVARTIAVPRIDIILLLVLFVVAIIPRAAWTAYADRAPQGLNDPVFYSLYSDELADGNGYVRFTGEKTAYYPVGYPATVAALKKAGDTFGWGRSIFSVKMMNGMFGAITVLLVFLLASRIFDRRVGVVAGLLEAVFPSQVYYGGTILSEAEFAMLVVAALLVLVWKPWSRDGMPWQQLFLAGVLLSAATMVRGITLMFPLVLLGVWVFWLRSKKRAIVQALIVWAGIAVLIVPWSIRNTVVFGHVTGPSTNVGDDLCIGNYLGAQGAFTLNGKCFEGDEGLPAQEVESRRNRRGVRIAIEDVLSDPFRMPKLIGQKAYWLLYRDDDGLIAAESYGKDVFIPEYRRDVLSFAANAIYYATACLMILGVLAVALSRDPRRLFVVLSMLYVLAIPLVFFGDPRFHFPAIPLAVIIAAATIVTVWDRRTRPLPEMGRLDASSS